MLGIGFLSIAPDETGDEAVKLKSFIGDPRVLERLELWIIDGHRQ